MLTNLKKAKEKESIYKEAVDNVNSYLSEFREKIDVLSQDLLEIEGERCEAVHGSINKFVVYEKFAEMSNKYDVNNFSKIIEEYNNKKEIETIMDYLDLKVPIP